ncbi:MAG: tRNA uridine-5-carboxymethylaminomethyl(34) synthesis GTPase MnmE [Candidatus Schekmanbacteria bacterium]|nr:tRNA uridine-5-carboxymethylaminomethyl(34) synthesis GTPase MnmE [Candidatus Schekmanbacteria bacterium]
MSTSDTIAALATPPGSSGIGIVRLSGSDSVAILHKIFRPSKKRALPSHTLIHGRIYNNEQIIDEVLVSIMRAPHSFTCEDVVEINCHGGSLPLRKALELCLHSGARPAEPGEFTRRAFLNGRIDLSQAEAVIDVINAKSQAALAAANSCLEGALSRKISDLRMVLLDLSAQIEVGLDYPDDEYMEQENREVFGAWLFEIGYQISRLLKSFSQGRLLREGIKVVIAGRPNVGKSSLLNCLLQRERAIVAPIPGTTRDTIEESYQLAGYPLCLIDTAGITHSRDEIEREGIRRSQKSLQQADLILLLLDSGQNLQPDDYRLLEMVSSAKTIVVVNKSDLPQQIELGKIENYLPNAGKIKISAKHGQGIQQLEEQIVHLLHQGRDGGQDELLLTNMRHAAALEQALSAIKRAQENTLPELIATDLREALEKLDEIIGLNTGEDLLDRIFSNFCVGK